MKRGYLFIAAGLGILTALFFAFQGTTFDLAQYWEYLLSLWRRFVTKANAAVSDNGIAKALDLIMGFEGFSAHRYPDANGYSIGYGHFILDGEPYDEGYAMTEEEAFALLRDVDAPKAISCVESSVKVPMTTNQEAALISFTYNVGCGAFKGSTLLRKLNDGDYAGASAEFSRWNKSQGLPLPALTDRRASEAEVFNS